MVGRRFGVNYGRAFKILISKIFRLGAGFVRTIHRGDTFPLKGVRYFIQIMKGGQVLFSITSWGHSPGRVKVGGRSRSQEFRAPFRVSVNCLSKDGDSGASLLVIMDLTSVAGHPTLYVFRVGAVGAVVRPRVFQPCQDFQWVSGNGREIRNLRPRWLVVLVSDVSLCCFFRDGCRFILYGGGSSM